MSGYDFRTNPKKELSFYVYDNLRWMQDNMNSSSIFYYDTLQEAIDKYKDLPKNWTSAIGFSLGGLSELDIVHRRMGDSVLVTDFKKFDNYLNNKEVQDSIDELIAYLNIQFESTYNLINNRNTIIELERYKVRELNSYFNDKILYRSDPKHMLSAITEVHVAGHGWMPIEEVLEMCDSYGYSNPEAPNITRLNINYISRDGKRGQADISTLDYSLLCEKTQRYHMISLSNDNLDFSNVRNLCYELYKLDWKQSHMITKEREMDSIKDYYEGLVDDDTVYTFNNYLEEFGYEGQLYSSFDEFLQNEYLSTEYMKDLLEGSKYIDTYLKDVDKKAIKLNSLDTLIKDAESNKEIYSSNINKEINIEKNRGL